MLRFLITLALVVLLMPALRPAEAETLADFLPDLDPAAFAEGADGFGAIRGDLPVAPVMAKGETIAWAFLTSDFVGTTGYSGKPIHVVAAISPDAVLTGVELVKHSEPIVLIGTSPITIVASPKLPVTSLPELFAYARANPGKLNAGTVGVGS